MLKKKSIVIDGKTYHYSDVVMLPSKAINKKGDICLFPYGLNIAGRDDIGYPVQHLYFLSDEEIKEGDWVYSKNITSNCLIYKVTGVGFSGSAYYTEQGIGIPINSAKKIIATTDSLLVLGEGRGYPDIKIPIPHPSQIFLEVFVREYNKENMIKRVLVELETYYTSCLLPSEQYKNKRVKINPKDNTITIRRVKDSWSRKEVERLIMKYALEEHSLVASPELGKWIKENL